MTVVLAATLCAACIRKPAVLPQDAYIWQRHWTAAIAQAMQESAPYIKNWRVLGAELDPSGHWQEVAPAWDILRDRRYPVILVVRIDGQLNDPLIGTSIAATLQLVDKWQRAGIAIGGVEIDHDCATARLPVYTDFLTRLRKTLRNNMALSITALPTWLESPALDPLLAVADEAVLQVHAVMNPRLGLFDRQRARAWLEAFAKRSPHPWRVALPTYGTRVTWSGEGEIAGVESERSALLSGGPAQELVAWPQSVASFVSAIERDPPKGLAGIVWFRLPTDNDLRAWSVSTWRAVLARAPLAPHVVAQTRATADPAMVDVMLANTGNADGVLPSAIRLDRDCRIADGVNGYVLETDRQGMMLKKTQDGLLRAGRERHIGWLRCDPKTRSLTLHNADA